MEPPEVWFKVSFFCYFCSAFFAVISVLPYTFLHASPCSIWGPYTSKLVHNRREVGRGSGGAGRGGGGREGWGRIYFLVVKEFHPGWFHCIHNLDFPLSNKMQISLNTCLMCFLKVVSYTSLKKALEKMAKSKLRKYWAGYMHPVWSLLSAAYTSHDGENCSITFCDQFTVWILHLNGKKL